MTTRRLSTLVTLTVLIASGAYLLVYLYRWEWNRALVAGVIFVAAEVAVVGTALLRRLRAIEARLDERKPSTLDRIHEAAPDDTPPFEWLDPTQLNVFVPVLLGAGVILSVIAHGVERLASVTTTRAHEHALAARLEGLALPAGGLGPGGGFIGLDDLRIPHGGDGQWRAVLSRAFGIVLAGFLTVVAIQVIADETQDRNDTPTREGRVAVTLQVRNRFSSRSELSTAEALFFACRHVLSERYRAQGFTDLGEGRIRFTVTPGFGEHGQRRLEGCLEDATFDRVSAGVVSFDHSP